MIPSRERVHIHLWKRKKHFESKSADIFNGIYMLTSNDIQGHHPAELRFGKLGTSKKKRPKKTPNDLKILYQFTSPRVSMEVSK